MSAAQRTPLYDEHRKHGARFVRFAGFEMPVHYDSVVAEHRAVRQTAGLFDVSHMGEVVIEGEEAHAAVQHLITNDIDRIAEGQSLYTVMCQADGGIVDDLIVYRESDSRYFLVVNAARRTDDLDHMRSVVSRFDCTIEDCSEAWALLALQGPKASEILSRITKLTLSDMKAFQFRDGEVGGAETVRVSRTGYTGEDGFELYCRAEDSPGLWRALFNAEPALVPCGLGARDTLRLEMKYPLYGNDIDLKRNPFEAGLGWTVRLAQGDFVGRVALERVKREGPKMRWVGFRPRDRRIPRAGYPILAESEGGKAIGVVTSGTHSPSLDAPIGVGYLPAERAEVGEVIAIDIRGKRVVADVVKTPFIERGRR